MGVLLYIISYLLKRVFFTICIVYNIIFHLLSMDFKGINEYFFNMAIGVDQLGNIAGTHLFNHIFIKLSSINKFGDPDETISSVLGKNKREESLTLFGKGLTWVLDKLDPNHAIKSIEQE